MLKNEELILEEILFDSFGHYDTRHNAKGEVIPVGKQQCKSSDGGYDTGYREIRWNEETKSWHEYEWTERIFGHDAEGTREEKNLGEISGSILQELKERLQLVAQKLGLSIDDLEPVQKLRVKLLIEMVAKKTGTITFAVYKTEDDKIIYYG